jgi:hypothetical protein
VVDERHTITGAVDLRLRTGRLPDVVGYEASLPNELVPRPERLTQRRGYAPVGMAGSAQGVREPVMPTVDLADLR